MVIRIRNVSVLKLELVDFCGIFLIIVPYNTLEISLYARPRIRSGCDFQIFLFCVLHVSTNMRYFRTQTSSLAVFLLKRRQLT